MSKLLIGWSEVSLFPNKKVKLAGQFFERVSDVVETPITATAMAVSSDGEQLVICSCDLVAVSDSLTEAVRAKLNDLELDAKKVIINATHSHTSLLYSRKNKVAADPALDILKRYLPEGRIYVEKVSSEDIFSPEEAFDFLARQIAQAVREAWENRRPAYYANEFGRAAVGMCRRTVYDDGTAKMWGDTNHANFVELEGGNDSGIELLYTFDANKKLTGVVANIACPSQVVEHRSFISSDYWGKVKIFLREKFGAQINVLALCGAGGDQCPRDMIRWVSPETPIDDPNVKRTGSIFRKADPSMFDIAGTLKIGKRIANEIIDVYDSAIEALRDTALLEHRVITIDMPIRRVTPTEYDEAKKAIEDYMKNNDKEAFDFSDSALLHIHAGTISRYEFQQSHDMCPIEVHTVRFGDIAIATNPFELFLDYGNQIKARSRAAQTFIIQLACGAYSYLPTKKAERHGHYSAYVSSGITGHLGGEILVRKTTQEINELWS